MSETMVRAREERNVGMARAAAHADMVNPKWSDVAYQFLCGFARKHPTFISEDVSDASKRWGMVQPPTDRAWGQVYRKAIRDGVIAQDGYGRSRRRHASICPRWKTA